MIHQAKFIDPGFGSLIYLRCENSQCESRQVKVDKEARFRPQFGAAIANLTDPDTNSFLVYKNHAGLLRFQCHYCKQITGWEDIPHA